MDFYCALRCTGTAVNSIIIALTREALYCDQHLPLGWSAALQFELPADLRRGGHLVCLRGGMVNSMQSAPILEANRGRFYP